jgi:hypothetical protein
MRPYTPADEINWLREMVTRRYPRAWWLTMLKWNRNRRWDFPPSEAAGVIAFMENVLRFRDHA